MSRMTSLTLLAAAVLAMPAAPAAGDVQDVVPECEACHGPGGVSADPDVPSLAGKSAAYIREVLEQFYYYERHCTTTTYRYGDRPKTPQSMCNMANSLTDEDKEAIAEYFANQ